MMKTNAQDLRGVTAPIYKEYPGQTAPQPAFIELDCEAETAEARYSGEIGNAVPMPNYYGLVLRFPVLPETRGQVLAEFLESEAFQKLAERIVSGFTSVWDGNNHRGHYSEESAYAHAEMTQLIERELYQASACVTVVDPEEYFGDSLHYNEEETEVSLGDMSFTADTAEGTLREIAGKLRARLDPEVYIPVSVTAWLKSIQSDLYEGEA